MSDNVTPEQVNGIFRVSAGSDALALATAVARTLLDGKDMVSVRAVGAGAVNQMVKSVAIARGKVATGGLDLICRPGFQTVPSKNGENMSAIVLHCQTR